MLVGFGQVSLASLLLPPQPCPLHPVSQSHPLLVLLLADPQMICQPVGPRCDICLLGTRKLCPTRVSGVKAEGRKPVLFSYKLDGQGDMEDMIKPDLGSGVGAQGIPQEGGVGSVRGIDGADGVGAEGEETEGLVRMKSEELGVSEPVLAREVGVKVEDS